MTRPVSVPPTLISRVRGPVVRPESSPYRPRPGGQPGETLSLSSSPAAERPALPSGGEAAAPAVAAAVPGALGCVVGTTILPDCRGRIGALALMYGNKEFEDPLPAHFRQQLLGVYETLFQRMDPRTEFFVVAPNAEDAAAVLARARDCGMQDPNRVRVLDARSEDGFSIWMRDSMLPVKGPGGQIQLLVQNRRYWPGPEDHKVPYWLASMDPRFEALPVPHLRFDGGNVLSDGKQTWVGADSIEETRERLSEIAGPKAPEPGATGLWRKASERALASAFGRPLTSLGNDDPSTQPVEGQAIFHYDMGVTPLKGRKALVGDPSLGIRILEGLSPEERAQVNREMALAAGVDPGRDLVGDLLALNRDPQAQANFENTKRELERAGYEVADRLPCLVGSDVGQVPYITYNNCIQEDYRDDCGERVRKVYLPQFGCRPLDEVARRVYEEQGFEVVPLAMATVSILEGAIRCSCHPLYRVGD